MSYTIEELRKRHSVRSFARVTRTPDTFYADEMAFFNLSEALTQMPWLQQGLEALACAPSGMNKQPVRVGR